MRKCHAIEEIRELVSIGTETTTLEFKTDYADPKGIGEIISGLSNAARLEDQEFAFLVWGVSDAPVAVVGTEFDPQREKVGGQGLEIWLEKMLSPRLALRFQNVDYSEGKRVVLLRVPAATNEPCMFQGVPYIRVGSATTKLADNPQRFRQLLDKLRPYTWETSLATSFVTPEDVLRLLDYESYFERVREMPPEGLPNILKRLESTGLVMKDVGCRWNITNLGAILFARDLNEFDHSLARKAVRIVTYGGADRTRRHVLEHEESQGYVPSYEKLVSYIMNQIPEIQHMQGVRRISQPLVPRPAVREALANALIHQDMTITGAGPLVEVFTNRVEIRNPGGSLVEPDRMIDLSARSRNERMARLMRRIGLCEELGTGIDMVFDEVEARHLPAPLLQSREDSMVVTLYGPRPFSDMSRDERIKACYYHTVLCCVRGHNMKNVTLRERFGVDKRNVAQISLVIRDTLERGLIRIADEERPRSGYLPFWQ